MWAVAHRSRTRGSRGVIALITGFAIFFVVTFSILMAELGLASLQRFEMHDASEAMAMAEGFQVLSTPSPTFGTRVSQDEVVRNNVRANTYASGTLLGYPVPVYDGATLSVNDAGGSQFDIKSLPQQSYMENVAAPLSVGGNARVVVNQFQVADMIPIPARIVLVVDYSRSMRLKYPGGTNAAKTILQNAITNILSDTKLAGRVDWGIVLFADVVGNFVSPVGPQPNGTYNGTDIATNKTQIAQDVAGPTFGDGTDLAAAVTKATTMLTGNGYSYGNISYGKNVIIIVTDGEPDVDPGAGPNTSYQQLVDNATGKATAAVQAAWSQGIETITILIKRDTTLAADADENFMKSIAGDGQVGGPTGPISDNAGVADFEGGLGIFLNMINPANHCVSNAPITPPPSSWMPAPDPNGAIYGFYVPSGGDIHTEIVVPRFGTNANMDPSPNKTTGEYPTNLPGFYFDKNTSKVELNVVICMNYLNNVNRPPKFRARYGLPRISWVGSM